MIDLNEPDWGKKLSEWFDTPEGKASLQELRDKMDAEDRAKEFFANRVKSMSVEKQDEWMRKIIARYTSDKYIDRWYKHGIFPPCWLYDHIREFIFENGTEVGETEDGSPIYQYNHWKLDCLYGQGERHHNFIYTEEEIHPYGENYVYFIYNPVVLNIGGEWFKSYKAAEEYLVENFGENTIWKIGIMTLNKKEAEKSNKHYGYDL